MDCIHPLRLILQHSAGEQRHQEDLRPITLTLRFWRLNRSFNYEADHVVFWIRDYKPLLELNVEKKETRTMGA